MPPGPLAFPVKRVRPWSRLRRWADWHDLTSAGWRPEFDWQPGPLSCLTRQAWEFSSATSRVCPNCCRAWRGRVGPVQPCLCDIWHDHVLFTRDEVTGLVDYGSVKHDHVAVDVARLLGSLIGDDDNRWRAGLAAYREVKPLTTSEEDLSRLLDRTGTLLGMVNWLTWLCRERRQFEDARLVARRLETLVRRVETWH